MGGNALRNWTDYKEIDTLKTTKLIAGTEVVAQVFFFVCLVCLKHFSICAVFSQAHAAQQRLFTGRGLM